MSLQVVKKLSGLRILANNAMTIVTILLIIVVVSIVCLNTFVNPSIQFNDLVAMNLYLSQFVIDMYYIVYFYSLKYGKLS